MPHDPNNAEKLAGAGESTEFGVLREYSDGDLELAS